MPHYQLALKKKDQERVLYLAVLVDTYERFFRLAFIQEALDYNEAHLLVYDADMEEIVQRMILSWRLKPLIKDLTPTLLSSKVFYDYHRGGSSTVLLGLDIMLELYRIFSKSSAELVQNRLFSTCYVNRIGVFAT
ncbi:hypothetical protein KFU94_56825 [Chloroflexi bacterium TSY]|nr:hypothetical protein [Chloroflexi bacterium TSY]